MSMLKICEKIAIKSVTLEIVNASVMVVIATAYVVWAIVDTENAKQWWWPYAIIELVLALWNLATYHHKNQYKKSHGGTHARRR